MAFDGQGYGQQPPSQQQTYGQPQQQYAPQGQQQQAEPGSNDSSGLVVVQPPATLPPPAPPAALPAPAVNSAPFVSSTLDFFPPSGATPVAIGSVLSPVAPHVNPSPFDNPPPSAAPNGFDDSFANFSIEEQVRHTSEAMNLL